METDSINFNNLISTLNEFGLKAKSQRFMFVDEIPLILAEDLLDSLYGKTIGTREGKKVIYYSDIKAWLDTVWHNGLTKVQYEGEIK